MRAGVPVSRSFRPAVILPGVIFAGRPPLRPAFRAASSPARVLSAAAGLVSRRNASVADLPQNASQTSPRTNAVSSVVFESVEAACCRARCLETGPAYKWPFMERMSKRSGSSKRQKWGNVVIICRPQCGDITLPGVTDRTQFTSPPGKPLAPKGVM